MEQKPAVHGVVKAVACDGMKMPTTSGFGLRSPLRAGEINIPYFGTRLLHHAREDESDPV